MDQFEKISVIDAICNLAKFINNSLTFLLGVLAIIVISTILLSGCSKNELAPHTNSWVRIQTESEEIYKQSTDEGAFVYTEYTDGTKVCSINIYSGTFNHYKKEQNDWSTYQVDVFASFYTTHGIESKRTYISNCFGDKGYNIIYFQESDIDSIWSWLNRGNSIEFKIAKEDNYGISDFIITINGR